MKRFCYLFLFVALLFTSCSEGDELLLENKSFLTTKSSNDGLSNIPEFEGVDFSKREKKILKNGIMVEIVDGLYIIDGDIVLTEEDIKRLDEVKPMMTTKAGVIKFDDLPPPSSSGALSWPNGVIPYVIESGHARNSEILAAMQEWSSKTSITFVPYTNQGNYLFFLRGADNNASYVGRRYPKQNIWIKYNATAGVAMHEIGHAIGLIHEHQRSDAANDIIVNESNIKPDWVQWFLPYSTPHYCLNRFNFNSIM